MKTKNLRRLGVAVYLAAVLTALYTAIVILTGTAAWALGFYSPPQTLAAVRAALAYPLAGGCLVGVLVCMYIGLVVIRVTGARAVKLTQEPTTAFTKEDLRSLLANRPPPAGGKGPKTR